MRFRKKGTENLRCQNKVENKSLQIKKIFILEKKKGTFKVKQVKQNSRKKTKQNWTKTFQRNKLTTKKKKKRKIAHQNNLTMPW